MKKNILRSAARLVLSVLLATTVLPVPQASRAATYDYYAQTNNLRVILNAGEKKQITLSFKNIGNNTWYGARDKTALYLYGDSSIFGNATWLTNDLPGLIAQSSVKPGQNATATFWVQAPKTPGTYNERFLLSYGINKWVKGSVAAVEFNVVAATSNPVATQPSATVSPVSAPISQSVSGYAALLVDKGGIEWQIEPSGYATVNLAFKNTGTKIWYNSGSNYVSIYTGKTDRNSPFQDGSWKSRYQPSVMKESMIKPGEVGHFTFKLKAPATTGKYTESYQLAAEDAAWIPGGTVDLPIKVASASAIINTITDLSTAGNTSGKYSGLLLLSSARSATLLGNGRLALTYGFKNTGLATWSTLSIKTTGVSLASSENTLISVRDESWYAGNEAVRTNSVTEPGRVGFVGFTIKAPAKKGTYTAHFALYADDNKVDGALIDIPITVTADGYIEPEPTATAQPSAPSSNPTTNVVPLGGDYSSLPNEPIIRVGLYQTDDDTMVVRAVSGGFSLQQNGSAVCSFNANEEVRVTYDRAAKVYKATGPRCTTQSSTYYVAAAPDNLAPLEMTDVSRPVSWLPGANDNKFRGKLELRYTPSSDLVWVINELPVEWYLKGIAETSNSSPQEYQRALLTAARTYAMYHVQRGTKHAAEYFTVDAKYDQVYRGYGAEIRDSNVVAAIDSTRGQIVTYQGKLAITPYYSRSDGRTRSWTEVWGGGPYAWLVGVPVPWDNGKTLWGHGVGMSATGALGMAADGWTYDKILKHFYTGIELMRIYK
ncbi:MAG: SpoIID/LytB domain-containing protein [Patescibacteria group bacterium]|nr:SpoIID/LytB domain-containing protein [Patescibacteria group bacterium]